jgi:hypothetical protein
MLRDFLSQREYPASFLRTRLLLLHPPQSDKIFVARLHTTAHRCRKGSTAPSILSDEIDVRPMSSAAGVNPRNAVIAASRCSPC